MNHPLGWHFLGSARWLSALLAAGVTACSSTYIANVDGTGTSNGTSSSLTGNSGANASGGTRSSSAAGAAGSSSGSGSGTAASTDSGTATGSGSSSSGSSIGGSTSGSGAETSTGGACVSVANVAPYAVCLLTQDCQCPYRCVANDVLDPLADAGQLNCELPCTSNAGCTDPDTSCTNGLCSFTCDPTQVEATADAFQPCYNFNNSVCPCPFRCVADPNPASGANSLCERLCQSDADCTGDAGLSQYCNLVLGVCQLSPTCGGGNSEGSSCQTVDNCPCPDDCLPDPIYGGRSCLLPCTNQDACANDGTTCLLDAGVCDPSSYSDTRGSCTDGVCGSCLTAEDCSAGLSCVADLAVGNARNARFCEDCSSGSCSLLSPGSCHPPPGLPEGLAREAICATDADCNCPDRCVFVSAPSFGSSAYLACRSPCTDAGSCPFEYQYCDPVAHACLESYCQSASGNLFNGSACDVHTGNDLNPDAGDGTCQASDAYPELAFGYQPGNNLQGFAELCVANGSAQVSCNPGREAQATERCRSGEVCIAQTADAGLCLPSCDADGGCALPSQLCLPLFTNILTFVLGDNVCVTQQAGGCAVGVGTVAGPNPNIGGFYGEFANCDGPGTPSCACPFTCTFDPVLGLLGYPTNVSATAGSTAYCERPCSTSADCPAPFSVCQGNLCTWNPAPCSGIGQTCNAGADNLDGTCLALSFPTMSTSGLFCQQAGSATGTCDPLATRANPSALCAAGLGCLPLGDGGSACFQLCMPDGGSAACQVPGQACAVIPNPQGSLDSSQAACFSTDAGCLQGHPLNDQASCQSSADCACGFDCVGTPAGPSVCARPCQQPSDCPVASQSCEGPAGETHCLADVCVCSGNCGAGACLTDGPNPGTCLGGLCYSAGTATLDCDPNGSRAGGQTLCVQGSLCSQDAPTPTCTPLCTSDAAGLADGGCAKDQICQLNQTFNVGECLPARGATP